MKTARYAVLCCMVFLALSVPVSFAELPTVVIVTTGGTIAEKTDVKTGGAVPAVSG